MSESRLGNPALPHGRIVFIHGGGVWTAYAVHIPSIVHLHAGICLRPRAALAPATCSCCPLHVANWSLVDWTRRFSVPYVHCSAGRFGSGGVAHCWWCDWWQLSQWQGDAHRWWCDWWRCYSFFSRLGQHMPAVISLFAAGWYHLLQLQLSHSAHCMHEESAAAGVVWAGFAEAAVLLPRLGVLGICSGSSWTPVWSCCAPIRSALRF